KATTLGSAKEITAVSIYGGSAVLLYLASTVYHAAFKSTFQPFLEVVDHAAIYVKIAGSYTPFALITLPTGSGLAILIAVWALAALGIGMKFTLHFFRGSIRQYDWISLAGYVGMGWLALFVVLPLFNHLPLQGFIWLVAGGLCFTIGAAFFAWKSVRYTHAIFHVWVLAGSVCHFVAIYGFVLGNNVVSA
ncbi:MAG: hemolysin III family protein, partial [Pseudomonadota bacterium]